jgi:hypothetical protein
MPTQKLQILKHNPMDNIGIIFKLNANPKTCIPLLKEDSESMRTFDSIKEAQSFAENHILFNSSDVIYIDLDMDEVIELA